ncbi:MAG: tetratricopeptide repeat protein [Anaerolineaceae bacterium]|nr:tetratricopeptide repeat protein [Anaerolineaceae bacterium]
MPDKAIKHAITLIQAGEKDRAKKILNSVLKQDPQNERAWLWVSKCFDEPERKKYCLERVLKINPDNRTAQKAIALLIPKEERKKKPRPRKPEESEEGEQLERKQKAGGIQISAGAIIALVLIIFIPLIIWAAVTNLQQPSLPAVQDEIVSHLTEIKVFCSSTTRLEDSAGIGFKKECAGYSDSNNIEISVEIFSGKEPEDILLVLGNVTLNANASREIAAETLGHIAAIPFKNAQPSDARSWTVRKSLAIMSGMTDEGDPYAEFGGVQFHLSKLSDTKYYLSIGEGLD